MSYELIALDIDGTLTNSEKIITPKTKRALLTLQEQGKIVALASGRPTPGLKNLAKELELERFGGYLLSYNGAKITNCKTNEVVLNQTIPQHMIPLLYDFAEQNDLGIITYEKAGVISGRRIDSFITLEAKINGIPVRNEAHFKDYVTFPVNKCLMTAEGSILAEREKELQALYADQLSIYRSEDFFLEVMPQNVDKARSLAHLLDSLGLTKEQLIACGDSYNDSSMIAYAGLGVAMANAKEEIKAIADVITKSNDEDGIAEIIEQYML